MGTYENFGRKGQEPAPQETDEGKSFIPRIKPNKSNWIHEQILAEIDVRFELQRAYSEAFM